MQLAAPCRSVRVVGDHSSPEIFLDEVAAVFSTRYYPAPGNVALELQGSEAVLYNLQ